MIVQYCSQTPEHLCYSATPPRSPICRLIVSEDLWALMDALQQPVPEEVDQHLENIHTSSTPLMVGSMASHSET